MKTYTVGEITKYIGNMFAQDFVLKNVKVGGEISNLKYHQSGHIYFTLKDDDAVISCAIFKSDAQKLSIRLENGLKCEIEGRITVYDKGGNYSLYGRKVTPAGTGDLYKRFAELKEELEDRGLFAPEYKQPIPKYIRKLGVVTAPTGAAIQDIINISTRRNPYVQIILYPALVQGDGASESIVKGIKALGDAGVDVMIVGRGGGSIEDLWAFNEEIVAQAIFDSTVPVISAVGHETDFTIADFVADMRAPTPSAAAEIAVYEADRITERIETLREDLTSAMNDVIDNARVTSERYKLRIRALSPSNQVLQKRTYLMNLEDRLSQAMNGISQDRRHRMQMYIERLKGLSPLDKLNQGYSVVTSNEGRIGSTSEAAVGDEVKIYVSDGYFGARITEVKDMTGRYYGQ